LKRNSFSKININFDLWIGVVFIDAQKERNFKHLNMDIHSLILFSLHRSRRRPIYLKFLGNELLQ
jgi:hypothetical protein